MSMNEAVQLTLKWSGDVIFLGSMQMGRVRTRAEGLEYDYAIGANGTPEYDFVSEPYQDKEDARQDCMRHVRNLLRKAVGA